MRLSTKQTRSWASVGVPPDMSDPHPMDQHEFQKLCAALHIKDCVTAGTLFGISWRSCQRYYYGEQLVPPPLARLLRLANKHKMSHKELLAL